jgi:exopolysaccharide biosynthesis polyprenyl glycosylphosphotransferase
VIFLDKKMATHSPQYPRQPDTAATFPATAEKRRDWPRAISVFEAGRDFGFPSLPAWVAADVFLVISATACAVAFAFRSAAPHVLMLRLTFIVGSYTCLMLLALRSCGLYQREFDLSLARQGFTICKAVALASVIFIVVQVSAGPRAVPPIFFLAAAVMNAASLASWRLGSRTLTQRRVAKGRSLRHALIVGSGQLGRSLAAAIEGNRDLGVTVKGFIDDRSIEGDPTVLGKLGDFLTVTRSEYIDEVYITLPLTRPGVLEMINRARERHLSLRFVPPMIEGYTLPLHYIGFHPTFTLHEEPVRGWAKFAKRLMDLIGASFLLIVGAPIALVVAIVVKLNSKGPVLYCADRVGYKGVRFRFYKFRTMVQNADELKEKLRQLNEREGPFFKITNDPRLTSIGRFLRATSLDEIPQILNVLRGDMSLVGPRPHPVDDYHQYRLQDRRRLDVLPGMTGLWQISARTDPSFERTMQLDLEYIENWSFWLDLKILVKTIPAVIFKRGV